MDALQCPWVMPLPLHCRPARLPPWPHDQPLPESCLATGKAACDGVPRQRGKQVPPQAIHTLSCRRPRGIDLILLAASGSRARHYRPKRSDRKGLANIPIAAPATAPAGIVRATNRPSEMVLLHRKPAHSRVLPCEKRTFRQKSLAAQR